VVSSLRSAGWADASAHPRHATWRESDITHLLLQDLMTSPSFGDGSLESVCEGQVQAKTGTGACPPFPARCQGPITAQTIPVGAGTAPDELDTAQRATCGNHRKGRSKSPRRCAVTARLLTSAQSRRYTSRGAE
jgi:hypothetical protein